MKQKLDRQGFTHLLLKCLNIEVSGRKILTREQIANACGVTPQAITYKLRQNSWKLSEVTSIRQLLIGKHNALLKMCAELKGIKGGLQTNAK